MNQLKQDDQTTKDEEIFQIHHPCTILFKYTGISLVRQVNFYSSFVLVYIYALPGYM